MTTGEWHHARVSLPSLGTITARLLVGEDGNATAVLLARPIRSLQDSIGSFITVDVSTEHDDRHHAARIVAVPHGDVLELQLQPAAPHVQRRELARIEVAVAVTVRPGRPNAPTVLTRTLNLSGGGALVAHVDPLQTNDRAQLVLELSDGRPPLSLSARVVRVAYDGLRGMRFEAITEPERDRIVRFVFAREREQRRIANGL